MFPASQELDSEPFPIGAAVGAAVGAVVLAFIVVAGFILIKRRRTGRQSICFIFLFIPVSYIWICVMFVCLASWLAG